MHGILIPCPFPHLPTCVSISYHNQIASPRGTGCRGRTEMSLVSHRSTPPFYTYIRSYALLRATSAFVMLQTFGIPPRGSCSAPLRGGDGLRSSTFLIIWRSENVCKCSCEHGICSRFPRCFLHIRQEAVVLDISVSAAILITLMSLEPLPEFQNINS